MNYWNNAEEKPRQNIVKNHQEKALGNVIAKPKQKLCKMPKQNHGKTNEEYAEGMQNTIKNEEPSLVYVNGCHCI